MFLNALQSSIVVAIIIVVAVQYAFALFCLLKLAYLDITKREYVLWNLFILLVFFIGGIAFLVYYFKVKDTKSIPPYVPSESVDENEKSEATAEAERSDEPVTETEKADDVEAEDNNQ